jgi:hypothetical protein
MKQTLEGFFFMFRGNGYAGFETKAAAQKKVDELHQRSWSMDGIRVDDVEIHEGSVTVKDKRLIDVEYKGRRSRWI